MGESSFGKAFGTSSGCLLGILFVVIGVPVLMCGGCMVLGIVGGNAVDSAREQAREAQSRIAAEEARVAAEEMARLGAIEGVLPLSDIAGADAAAVIELLGEPATRSEITDTPEWMPGEILGFTLPGVGSADVRFKDDRAVNVIVYFDPPFAGSDRAAFYRAGLPVPLTIKVSPLVSQYTGEVDGLSIQKAIATATSAEANAWSQVSITFK